jgi:hypothetical protein
LLVVAIAKKVVSITQLKKLKVAAGSIEIGYFRYYATSQMAFSL